MTLKRLNTWVHEEVVFYQKDGGQDRLQVIHQMLNGIFGFSCHKSMKDIDKVFEQRRAALNQWKADYPDADVDSYSVNLKWIGQCFTAFSLHHWYERIGKHIMANCMVDSIDFDWHPSLLKGDQSPYLTLNVDTYGAPANALWDEFAKINDLEYVHFAVDESLSFFFNTDVEHRYIKKRYRFAFDDGYTEDEMPECYLLDANELIYFMETHLPEHDIEQILAPHFPALASGNLMRIPIQRERIIKSLNVEDVCRAINSFLFEQTGKDKYTPTFYWNELHKECK